MQRQGEDGISLIEVMVATGILIVALVSLAQLLTTAIRDNLTARHATYATILAGQKIEELRALAWSADGEGFALSDPALSRSPSGALTSNTAGFVDYLDQFGHLVAGGGNPPEDAVYTRRWAIEPSPDNPDDTIVIQVVVTRNPLRAQVGRQPDEAHLVTVRTRRVR